MRFDARSGRVRRREIEKRGRKERGKGKCHTVCGKRAEERERERKKGSLIEGRRAQ